ncbi:hypothetical protein [Paractinoplanes ferrugineus]|nr:hypothetical protein [Actinoplanes ferrugineus]
MAAQSAAPGPVITETRCPAARASWAVMLSRPGGGVDDAPDIASAR